MHEALSVLVTGVLLGGVYALISLGLNMIFGVLRMINFAHGELVMLGMYGTYLCVTYLGIPAYASVVIVAPALSVVGYALHRFIMAPLHSQPNMQIFATFGLLILLENAVLALTRGETYTVPSSMGIPVEIGELYVGLDRLLIFAIATLLAVGTAIFLRKTMPGKAVRAITQDRTSAQLMGVNAKRVFSFTFATGAAIAGLGGVLLAPAYSLSPYIGGNFILAAFAVVVLGGLGSVAGAYFGGLLVGIVESFAGYYIDPALKQAIWFVLFVVVLVLRPSGLFGQVGAEEVGLRPQH